MNDGVCNYLEVGAETDGSKGMTEPKGVNRRCADEKRRTGLQHAEAAKTVCEALRLNHRPMRPAPSHELNGPHALETRGLPESGKDGRQVRPMVSRISSPIAVSSAAMK